MINQNDVSLLDEVGENRNEFRLFDTNFFLSLLVLKLAFVAGGIIESINLQL